MNMRGQGLSCMEGQPRHASGSSQDHPADGAATGLKRRQQQRRLPLPAGSPCMRDGPCGLHTLCAQPWARRAEEWKGWGRGQHRACHSHHCSVPHRVNDTCAPCVDPPSSVAVAQLVERRTPLGAVLSAPLASMLLALAAAAAGVLPTASGAADAIWTYLMPLGAALYLLESDLTQ